jgi:hypothetical protein
VKEPSLSTSEAVELTRAQAELELDLLALETDEIETGEL